MVGHRHAFRNGGQQAAPHDDVAGLIISVSVINPTNGNRHQFRTVCMACCFILPAVTCQGVGDAGHGHCYSQRNILATLHGW